MEYYSGVVIGVDLFSKLGCYEIKHILTYLPINDRLSMTRTAKYMYQIARCNDLWVNQCGEILKELADSVNQSVEVLAIISRKAFAERNSYERLDFLRGTCVLLLGYLSEQYTKHGWINTPSHWVFYTLLNNIKHQIIDVNRMLGDLNTGLFQITVNFDIFEIALRKYYEELVVMVPVVIPSILSSSETVKLILDDSSLTNVTDCWNRHFEGKLIVPFDAFIGKIITELSPEDVHNERCVRYLSHLFNFPRDNVFSVYRFRVFVLLFGPLEMSVTNFKNFALSNGFVGAINMIKAEELLTELLPKLRRSTVLMRFSRRQPEFIAFTSIDVRTGKVEHRRNVNNAGKSVPIAQYLARAFPGYDLIRMGIDDMATHVDTTFKFARYNSPYFHDT
jgi:hypothetical protein